MCMVLDYGGAWLVDIMLKRTLADMEPKPSMFTDKFACYFVSWLIPFFVIAVITKGLERREARRKLEEAEEAKTIAAKKTA